MNESEITELIEAETERTHSRQQPFIDTQNEYNGFKTKK